MAARVADSDEVETFADVMRRIGVSASRIWLRPTPGTATEADLLAAANRPRKRLCELIDGTLVEKPMGQDESLLTVWLAAWLGLFIELHNLGILLGPDGFVRLFPGRVRAPDLAYTSWDRFPERRRPRGPIVHFGPDLAVEFVSRSNTLRELKQKRRDYFGCGCRSVWEIDPRKRVVRVYASVDDCETLEVGAVLTGDPVLPGFRVALADLFGELDRSG